MFGYITADYSRLSKSAKKQYKSAYCGLCRALSKKYGASARFILNFDSTFLLLVLSDADKDFSCKDCACPYHFGRKRACLDGGNCDYAADITVLLTCLKFEDDIKDSRSLKAKFLKRVYKKAFEKAKKGQPKLYEKLVRALTELEKAEKRGEQNPFVCADIFGYIMENVFAVRPALCDFGFYLGRFIYLCDAVCDFKSDLKHGRYNPLTANRVSEFEDILAFNIERCIDIAEQTGLCSEVISNVLHYGVWLKYSLKYKRKIT